MVFMIFVQESFTRLYFSCKLQEKMPKIDRLDALGECQNGQNMLKICPRYANNIPVIWSRYSQDMPKICPRYVQDMPMITWIQEMLTHLKTARLVERDGATSVHMTKHL